MTASPPFMSQVPSPCRRVAVVAARQVVVERHRVEVAGDARPARPRPRSVRATTVLPRRVTVEVRRAARSAASTASAIACSLRLTDSMSTSCSVSVDDVGGQVEFHVSHQTSPQARDSSITGDSTSASWTAKVVARVSRLDQGGVGSGGVRHRGTRGHVDDDPVGHVETGVAPRLLYGAHEVARDALRLELGRHGRVEHDEPAAGQHPGGGVGATAARRSRGRTRPPAAPAPGGDLAVVGHRPVARLRRPDRGLHVLPQPRTGGAGVDREPLRDAVRRGVRVVGVEQAHVLHVELVGDDRLEPGERGRRRRPPRSATTAAAGCGAPAPLRSAEPAEQTSRTWSIAVTSSSSAGRSSAAGQSVRCTDRSPVSPRQTSSVVSGSSGAVTRQTVSSTVKSVSNASRRRRSPSAGPEALARAADVPVRQHVEERPRGVAGVRDLVVVELPRQSARRTAGSWPAGSGPSGASDDVDRCAS